MAINLSYLDQIDQLKKSSNASAKNETLIKENSELHEKIAAKERDIETLKKQAAGLSREYQALGDQVNAQQNKEVKKDA